MLKLSVVLCAASTVWACGDGQAEDDYLGEPLFTAHGSVVSSDVALTPELILSLRFAESSRPPDFHEMMHFVKAEVAGSFPNAFTMRIYEPPPPAAVVATVPGEPAFARGTLQTVRADHPDRLRIEHWPEGGQLTDRGLDIFHTCAEDGECRDIDLRVPECRAYSDYGPCPGVEKPDDKWANYGGAYGFDVVYFAEATPAGSVTSRYFAGGQPIGKGYHLLMHAATAPDTASSDAYWACLDRARHRARAAVNTRHGREPEVEFGFLDPFAFSDELPGEEIIAQVEEGCSQPGDTWVEDPSSVSLKLILFRRKKDAP